MDEDLKIQLAEAEEKYKRLEEEYDDYSKKTHAEINRLHEVCRSKDMYIRQLEDIILAAGFSLPE